jgi:hypothetical protein
VIQSHLLPIFIGWLAASLALIAEHIALLRQPWQLTPPATYIVGVLTILGGCAIWALIEPASVEPLLALLAFAVISMGSGAWVLLLYWLDERSARARTQAARTAEIVGAAKGLTQEIIDRGSRGKDPSRHDN